MLALQRRFVLCEHPLDDLARLVERLEPLRDSFEIEAEAIVLELEPSGAQPEGETAAADLVERRSHLRGQGWVAIGVAIDQRADACALGVLAQRAEQRPALHTRTGWIGHEDGIEVVEVPQGAIAPSVDLFPEVAHPLPGDVLLAGLNSKTNRVRRHSSAPRFLFS